MASRLRPPLVESRYAVSTCPTQALCSSMKLLKFPLLITFSLLVLIMGTPNIEESREEARSAQAFMDAQEIKAGTRPLSTLDPWGMPFHISKDANNGLVVTSFGPNKSTGAKGFDDDDVSSAMSFPPHKRMMRCKQVQSITTLILSVGPWVFLFLWWCCSAALPQRPRRQSRCRN